VPEVGSIARAAGSGTKGKKGSRSRRHALARKRVGCRTSLKSCCFLVSVVRMYEVYKLQSYDHIRCLHF
jgi:hypothetical protein